MNDKKSFAGLRFGEEQLDFLAHWMRKEMCHGKSSKYVNYCLRVHTNELHGYQTSEKFGRGRGADGPHSGQIYRGRIAKCQ